MALMRICQVQHGHVVWVTTLPVRKAQAAPAPQPVITLRMFAGTSCIMEGLHQSFANVQQLLSGFTEGEGLKSMLAVPTQSKLSDRAIVTPRVSCAWCALIHRTNVQI